MVSAAHISAVQHYDFYSSHRRGGKNETRFMRSTMDETRFFLSVIAFFIPPYRHNGIIWCSGSHNAVVCTLSMILLTMILSMTVMSWSVRREGRGNYEGWREEFHRVPNQRR